MAGQSGNRTSHWWTVWGVLILLWAVAVVTIAALV